ncbi:DNA (cytosine-5-)-methyltransferase [bacterium]|nr:DNA (cytosine-5-)-methyltransferase [bacterium]
MKSNNKIKVVELFAGVGGFRLGLEKYNFEIVWSNQWEPITKTQQHASDVYVYKFGENNHCNEDINTVKTKDIPDHDMLVGGFPCQDYSVANTLKLAGGLKGKKGVLWWNIEKILREKKSKKPKYLLLENVDRLLKSPASQRGRDFAIMLASLSDLGYGVEWRIINAADYGMPQRRRRVFFLAYHKSTNLYKEMKKNEKTWINDSGILAKSFPCESESQIMYHKSEINGTLEKLTKNFNKNIKNNKSPFNNSGIMINRKFISTKVSSIYTGKRTKLKDIIISNKDVHEDFFVDKVVAENKEKGWAFHKGAKKKIRKDKKTGFTYTFSEGSMSLTDDLNKPSRTIITGEGGKSPSRTKHLILNKGKYRRLTPLELERLNMFPDNFTQKGINGDILASKRAFLMGNALVVGVVEKIGNELEKRIKNEI